MRYNAIGWETGVINRRYHELKAAQGKVLEDAKRFFPNGKGWKAWLKRQKTCDGTSCTLGDELDDALYHVGYQPDGRPENTITKFSRQFHELLRNDDARVPQVIAAVEQLIAAYMQGADGEPDATVETAIDAAAATQPTSDVSFDDWLAQFKSRYASLTPDQQLQVDRAMGDVEAQPPTAG